MAARWWMAVLVALTLLPGAAGGQGRPVALVASGSRSGGDRNFFRHYVIAPLEVVSEDCGEFLEPAEFSKFSLVVWLRSAPRKFTPEQAAAMKGYLEGGGRVLMTNGAIYSAFDRSLKEFPWLGAQSWGYSSAGYRAEALDPANALLGEVGADAPEAVRWLTAPHALNAFRGVSLLGKAGAWATLGYIEIGKGRLYFSGYGPYEERDLVSQNSVMQSYRNIVRDANPLSERDEAAALLKAAAPGRRVALWRREWSGATEQRLLWSPAGPRPGETLTAIEFASVRNETDTAFLCVQSVEDIPSARVTAEPLKRPDGTPSGGGALSVLVMGRAPVIPFTPAKNNGFAEGTRDGPFYLLPRGTAGAESPDAFRLNAFRPRTIWVQMDTRGLPPGRYESRLHLSTAAGESLAALPVRVDVAPVLMPEPRLVQLRTWGGGIHAEPRLVREMRRRGTISYPDLTRVRLRNSEVTLQSALRDPKRHLLGRRPIPRLDFTAWGEETLDLFIRHGITNLVLLDIRTGESWAGALTGGKCDVTSPFEEWPAPWREAFVDYYAQLQEYLSERGYLMAYPLWTDEPDLEGILKSYLPRAKAYMAAGMGPGSHWTTPGWMTPEMTNLFAPWTRDFSMYQYGYPNFQRFLREGTVKLPEHSIVGFTRGGTGLAVRQPHAQSRILGWQVIHQGPPAHFVRTGPIWKSWLYYVDFTAMSWSRAGGVQGERLISYGSSDPKDLSAEMLSSSDWEGARDGVDDANLARMVEWYLPRLRARADGPWKDRLAQIEADRARWFKKDGPFPIGEKPVDYRWERKDQPLFEYHITVAEADATPDMDSAKRHVIGLLREMAPHTRSEDIQVSWHDWVLVRDGRPAATVMVSPGASEAVKSAAREIAAHVARDTGVVLPLRESDDPGGVPGRRILVAEAKDAPAVALMKALDVQLDARYPGAGSYRILRRPERDLVAILGTDEAGVARGVRNWRAFVNPQGHWLLNRP